MKLVIPLAVAIMLFNFSAMSYADELPEWFNLPNYGEGCTRLSAFGRTDKDRICGQAAYSVYSCKQSDQPAKTFLLVGKYATDADGGECQATYIVEKVIAAD